MRAFLPGRGWLLILGGVASAVAAPWSSTPLIELLGVLGSAILQTAGVVIVALRHTDRRCEQSRHASASDTSPLELGGRERCIGGAA